MTVTQYQFVLRVALGESYVTPSHLSIATPHKTVHLLSNSYHILFLISIILPKYMHSTLSHVMSSTQALYYHLERTLYPT
jgi:hypothetical protein